MLTTWMLKDAFEYTKSSVAEKCETTDAPRRGIYFWLLCLVS